MSSNRRIKIRPPKRNLDDGIDLEKSWNVLSSAISEIYNKNASTLSFEFLYRKCYHLVLRRQGETLYRNVKNQLKNHLLEKRLLLLKIIKLFLVQSNLNEKISKNIDIPFNTEILMKVIQEWEDNCLSIRMISDVLMYLDRVYIKESQLPLIYDVGVSLFKECIIEYNNNEIGDFLNKMILSGISNNRSGLLVDKFLIKSIIKMFESLIDDNYNNGSDKLIKITKTNEEDNYYLKNFEPYFMEKSFEYYQEISKNLLNLENGHQYISKVQQIIIEEENISSIYLPRLTFPKQISLLNNILLEQNINKVIELNDEGFEFWINNSKFEDLKLLFSLVARIDKFFNPIQAAMKKYILLEGSQIESKIKESTNKKIDNEDKKKKIPAKQNATVFAIQWIENVLKFTNKISKILEVAFQKNIDIERSIENGFVELLNKNSKMGEFLSLYIDNNIKKSSKNKTEEEYEKALNNAVKIFKYIKDKDLFEKYYKTHLTKRLLQQKSASIDIERSMILKLRQEVGSLYTSQLEGMFKDMKVSREYSQEYSNSPLKKELSNNKVNFDINILTSTYWPLQVNKVECEKVKYPNNLKEILDNFEVFYKTKHKGRDLIWSPNLSSIDIRCKYKKKTYEINMPTYCGIIILLFENYEELTFEEISQMTQIPKQDLIRHLLSISVAPKTRLLEKKPMSKDIKFDDIFKINENFESSTSKIKVLTVSLTNKVENDEERKNTINSVNNSRKFEIDAAIVRIMKSRKVLNHNELLSEIVKQLGNRFRPPPSFIKLRIESLLEREYIARDNKDKSKYIYLA